MVQHRDAIDHDQRRALREGEVAQAVSRPHLDLPPFADPADAQFGDELHEQLLHHREAGVVVQHVGAPVVLSEELLVAERQVRIERIRVEIALDLHPEAAQLQRRGIRLAELQRRDFARLEIAERALQLQVADIRMVHALDLQEHFLFAIDIGRIERDRPVAPDGGGIDILAAARRRDDRIFVLHGLHPGGIGPRDAGSQDLPFVLRHRLRVIAPEGRELRSHEIEDILSRRGGNDVPVAHRQVEEDRPPARVGERQPRRTGAGRRLELQRTEPDWPLLTRRNAVCDRHALRTFGRERVEDGQGPGARQRVESRLAGSELRVGEQAVIARRERIGELQGGGAAAAVQGDLGRAGQAVGTVQLDVGDLAESGQLPRLHVHAEGRQPHRVTGHEDVPVGGQVHPFAQRLRALQGDGRTGEQQEYAKDYLSHLASAIGVYWASLPASVSSRRARCSPRSGPWTTGRSAGRSRTCRPGSRYRGGSRGHTRRRTR